MHYKNFINGEYVESESNEFFKTFNPANFNEVLGEFPQSTRGDIEKAVEAAANAFSSWKRKSPVERGEIFYKVASKLDERFESFSTTLVKETGKTKVEANGEVNRAISVLRFMAGEATRFSGDMIPVKYENAIAYTVREPLGVVGIITPWNFPLGLAASKTTPALIAGNTVVFKPASTTPLISLMYVQLLEECGIPKGVINFVTGPGSVTGDVLANHSAVKALSFTGSTEVGQALAKVVSARGAKIQAEMGGKNPFIILEDADIDLAVEHIIFGGFGECGQRCTATSRVIVHDSIYQEVVDKLVEKTKEIKVGDPLHEETQMGVVIDSKQVATFDKYVEIAKNEGAKLEIGGSSSTKDGYYVTPTIFTDVNAEMTIAKEEVFGPILAVIPFTTFEEALSIANAIEYGLSASLYTNDLNKSFNYIKEIEAGVVHVNMPSTYSEPHLPFGGMKNTTIGPREQGHAAIQFYSETRTVYIKA